MNLSIKKMREKSAFKFFVLSLLIINMNQIANACLMEGVLLGQIQDQIDHKLTLDQLSVFDAERFEQIADDRVFTGYRARVRGTEKKATIFIVPGNVQFTREIMHPLQPLLELGYELVGFDYVDVVGRYSPKNKYTIQDVYDSYRFVLGAYIDEHQNRGERFIVYGASSGGAVSLNFADLLRSDDILILDAVPDKLPFPLVACGRKNPEKILKYRDISHLDSVMIRNSKDRKVRPKNSSKLNKKIQGFGGCNLLNSVGKHPFEEDDPSDARVDLLKSILDGSVC